MLAQHMAYFIGLRTCMDEVAQFHWLVEN